MSEKQRFEGKTLEAALESACQALGVQHVSELDYEIETEGGRGMLGLMSKNWVVLAAVRAVVPDSGFPAGGDETRETPAAGTGEARAAAPDKSRPERPRRSERRPRETEGGRPPAREGQHAASPAPSGPPAAPPPPPPPELVAAKAAQAAGLARDLFAAMGLKAEAAARVDGTQAILALTGDDAGIFTGARSHAMDAFTHIINKMVNRTPAEVVRIATEAQGSISERQTALEKEAVALAALAVSRKQPVAIKSMNARDRRLIHLALRENKEVATQSEGDGAARMLYIVPANAEGQRPPARREPASGDRDRGPGAPRGRFPGRERGPRRPRED